MSEAIKPTTEQPWSYVPEGQMIVMGGDITRMIADVRGWGWIQKYPNGAEIQDANGRLLAEAGQVHHETGLTPRQLVERVKELETAAKLVLDWYEAENDHSKADFYQRMQMCRDSEDAIRAALSKSLPNTVAEVKE